MEIINFALYYKADVDYFARCLEGMTKALRKVTTKTDVARIRKELDTLALALGDQENRWFDALIRFAAGDHSKDNECGFHGIEYSRGCFKCRSCMAANTPFTGVYA